MAGLTPICTQWFECTVFLGKEVFGSINLVRISSAHFPPRGWESMVPTRSSLAWDNRATVDGFGGAGWNGRLCTPGLASVYCTEKVGHRCTGLFGDRVLAIWDREHGPSSQSQGSCRAFFHRLRAVLARDVVSFCLAGSETEKQWP